MRRQPYVPLGVLSAVTAFAITPDQPRSAVITVLLFLSLSWVIEWPTR